MKAKGDNEWSCRLDRHIDGAVGEKVFVSRYLAFFERSVARRGLTFGVFPDLELD